MLSEERQKNSDFLSATDPFDVFNAWLDEASKSEVNDPNAASLATVDETGMPNVRVVLVKAVDASGFVMYTNLTSQKGKELLGQRKAALVFHWKTLGRQVRARGPIIDVSTEDADAYYASRPRGSRIGAWASNQSSPLEHDGALKLRVEEVTARFDGEDDIPRPPNWGGFKLEPVEMELWHDRPYRLHDRIQFKRSTTASPWTSARLYP